MDYRSRRPTHPKPATALRFPEPEPGPVHWFEPDEDLSEELILSGAVGAKLEQLATELVHVERFIAAEIDPPTRVLFSGPSGTGKTLTARWLGWKLRRPVAVLDIARTIGSTLGKTSQNLGDSLDAARARSAILFLDELEAMCAKRSGGEDGAASDEMKRATSTLLQRLDWLPPGQVVIAATNYPELLDPALRRRLAMELVFEEPDRAARLRMVKRWLRAAAVPPEVLEGLVADSEGFSGAALRALAMAEGRKVVMAAAASDARVPRAKRTETGTQGVLRALDDLK